MRVLRTPWVFVNIRHKTTAIMTSLHFFLVENAYAVLSGASSGRRIRLPSGENSGDVGECESTAITPWVRLSFSAKLLLASLVYRVSTIINVKLCSSLFSYLEDECGETWKISCGGNFTQVLNSPATFHCGNVKPWLMSLQRSYAPQIGDHEDHSYTPTINVPANPGLAFLHRHFRGHFKRLVFLARYQLELSGWSNNSGVSVKVYITQCSGFVWKPKLSRLVLYHLRHEWEN